MDCTLSGSTVVLCVSFGDRLYLGNVVRVLYFCSGKWSLLLLRLSLLARNRTCCLLTVGPPAAVCVLFGLVQGDSRAVLYKRHPSGRGLASVAVTRDHKPNLPSETKRILLAGGWWMRCSAVQPAHVSPPAHPFPIPEPICLSAFEAFTVRLKAVCRSTRTLVTGVGSRA